MRKALGRFSLLMLLAMLVVALPSLPCTASTGAAMVTGVVQLSDGSPVAGAPVQLIGATTFNSQSDASGTFVFVNVPYGTYNIVVKTKELGEAGRNHIVVTGDINVAVRYGVSVNGMHVIAQVATSQPISTTILTPQTLAAQGETTWKHVLNEIPGVNVGLGGATNAPGKTTDTFAVGRGSFTQVYPDSPLGAQLLQIGGALPNESSASLDDMPILTETTNTFGPITGTGGVDLAVYDPNAFSQYTLGIGPGADTPSILNSVGGNLNLSVPGSVSKNQASFSVANDPYGGLVSNMGVALHVGRLSFHGTYGINDSPGPFGGQVSIPIATTPAIVDGKFFACGVPGGFSPPACSRYTYYSLGNSTGYQLNFGSATSSVIMCCASISSAWQQHSGSASLLYQVSPTMSAQIFYAGSQSMQSAYPGLVPTTFVPPIGYTGPLQAGVYDLSCFFDLPIYRQSSSLLEEKLRTHLGKGELTLAAMQNTTRTLDVSTNPSSAQMQLWGGGCYTNVYGSGSTCTGSAIFSGETHTVEPHYYSLVTGSGAGYNRDELLEYDRPLGDRYQLKATYVASSFENGTWLNSQTFTAPGTGSGFSQICTEPADSFNTTQDIHLSLGGAVTSRLNVTLSEYFANLHYHGLLRNYHNTAGSFVTISEADERFSYQTPHLGIVFRPSDKVVIRASAGGAFVAPPISNYVGYVAAIFPSTFSIPPTYTDIKQNLALKSESSFGFSLGTDVRLARYTIFSLDLYRTNLHGQFYTSQFQEGTFNDGIHGTLPLIVNQTINLGQTRYEGISASIHHDVPHGWFEEGQFGFTRGYLISTPPGFYDLAPNKCNAITFANCTNLSVIPEVNYIGFPYSQGFGTLGYRWSPQRSIDFDITYYGPNNSYYRPAFVVLNANAEIPLTKVLSLHATARNITGIYDQSIMTYDAFQNPEIGVPQVVGPAYYQPGIFYGPRSVVVTVEAHL